MHLISVELLQWYKQWLLNIFFTFSYFSSLHSIRLLSLTEMKHIRLTFILDLAPVKLAGWMPASWILAVFNSWKKQKFITTPTNSARTKDPTLSRSTLGHSWTSWWWSCSSLMMMMARVTGGQVAQTAAERASGTGNTLSTRWRTLSGMMASPGTSRPATTSVLWTTTSSWR